MTPTTFIKSLLTLGIALRLTMSVNAESKTNKDARDHKGRPAAVKVVVQAPSVLPVVVTPAPTVVSLPPVDGSWHKLNRVHERDRDYRETSLVVINEVIVTNSLTINPLLFNTYYVSPAWNLTTADTFQISGPLLLRRYGIDPYFVTNYFNPYHCEGMEAYPAVYRAMYPYPAILPYSNYPYLNALPQNPFVNVPLAPGVGGNFPGTAPLGSVNASGVNGQLGALSGSPANPNAGFQISRDNPLFNGGKAWYSGESE